MTKLTNVTYDELSIGQTASFSKTFTEDLLVLFAEVSGDVNPVHLDAEFAATTFFKERIAHGAWTASIVSGAIALEMPGPGSIYLKQDLTFTRPVKVNDIITVNLEILEKTDKSKAVLIKCEAVNQDGKTVAVGTAKVKAPTEKLVLDRPSLPVISIASNS